jgi:RNA polymerase sigma factor (sigma-70 family)
MAHDLESLSTDELLKLASTPAEAEILPAVVAQLVIRYKGVVYNQALHICRNNRALAEEVFQETFLRLFRWLREQKDSPTLHTFPKLLSVFTKRTAIDLMRKELTQTPTAPMWLAEQVPGEVTDLETKAYVLQLLEELEPKSREVVKLTYFDDLSAVEIAQKLGLSAGNVRILRFRAMEGLRQLIERDRIADSLDPL